MPDSRDRRERGLTLAEGAVRRRPFSFKGPRKAWLGSARIGSAQEGQRTPALNHFVRLWRQRALAAHHANIEVGVGRREWGHRLLEVLGTLSRAGLYADFIVAALPRSIISRCIPSSGLRSTCRVPSSSLVSGMPFSGVRSRTFEHLKRLSVVNGMPFSGVKSSTCSNASWLPSG